MKPFFHIFVVTLAMAAMVQADEPSPVVPTPTPAAQGKRNVRVEVFMVSMPEEKALAVLPDLHDETKIDATTIALLNAVKRKEMILAGYQTTVAIDGGKTVSETNLEKIYPTQFQPPEGPGDMLPTPPPTPAGQALMPTSFEKRNTGVTLEVEVTSISDDDKLFRLSAEVQHVEFQGSDSYEIRRYRDGMIDKVEQPLFFAMKNSFDVNLRNGQRVLIGTHKTVKPEGYLELFILQATVMPHP